MTDELICKSWSGNNPKIFDNTEKSDKKDGISNITKGTITAKTDERIFADTNIERVDINNTPIYPPIIVNKNFCNNVIL